MAVISFEKKFLERWIERKEHSISFRIMYFRTLNNLERSDLAQRLHITEDDLRLYENGHLPVPATLIFLLSKTLNVSPERFFEEKNSDIQTDPDILQIKKMALNNNGAILDNVVYLNQYHPHQKPDFA